MLKYVDTKVVFSEIPEEITLAINLSRVKKGKKLNARRYRKIN